MNNITNPSNEFLNLYKNNLIDLATVLSRLEFVHLTDSQKKNQGAIYTPLDICNYMVELINPKLDQTIIEPACGRGNFIFAIFNFFKNKYNPQSAMDYIASNLTAFDIDQIAIDDFKSLYTIFLKKHNLKNIKLPKLLNQDFLNSKLTANLIISNPPYIRFQNLNQENRNFLKNNFQSCKLGNYDLYYAFIEKTLNQSDQSIIICPNSWISNKSALNLRTLLQNKIKYLIDFKEKQIFPNARTYISIILTDSLQENNTLFYANDLINTDEFKQVSNTKIFAINQYSLKKTTFSNIANIYSGIATLSDKTFIVEKISQDNDIITFKANNKIYTATQNYLPLYLKLTKINSINDINNNKLIIYPYDDNLNIIEETKLKNDAPDLYSYLLENKNTLLNRDKGKTQNYPSWFAYGRKQGLKNINSNEFIALKIMCTNKIEFTHVKQNIGKFLFTSGFIITPKENYTFDDIINFLNHPNTWQYVKEHGKAWASNNQNVFRSFGVKFLENIPLP